MFLHENEYVGETISLFEKRNAGNFCGGNNQIESRETHRTDVGNFGKIWVVKHDMKLLKRFFLLAAAVVTVIIVADLIKIFSYKTYPANPPDKIVTKQDELYAELISGNDFIDWDKLNRTLQFIKNEYDVSDFKMVNLIRILYEYREFIPSEIKHRIDSVLLGFRYWMDEPNRNSICYWSENHQILFSSAEYLIGKLYEKNVFFGFRFDG